MIDLKGLVNQFEQECNGRFSAPEPREVGTFPNGSYEQDTEKIDIFQNSQFPTAKQEIYKSHTHVLKKDHTTDHEKNLENATPAHVTPMCGMENVGTPGKPNENNTLSFPLYNNELGNREKREARPASAVSQDPTPAHLLRADPQDTPLQGDGEPQSALSSTVAPLIEPSHIRAGVERELRALSATGLSEAQAMARAVEITRAKVRNSPAFFVRQADQNICHVCGGRKDAGQPFIAVLTPAAGTHHWLHRACHGEHIQRQSAKVDALMTAAGFSEGSAP